MEATLAMQQDRPHVKERLGEFADWFLDLKAWQRCGIIACMACALLTPTLAFGWDLATLFGDPVKGLFKAAVEISCGDGVLNRLGSDARNMLGSDSAIYNIVVQISNTVVRPIAASILSLVLLVQLVKVAERMDGHATIPGLKEIVQLVVFAVIFTWFVRNGTDICAALFDDMSAIQRGMIGYFAGGGNFPSNAFDNLNVGIENVLPMLLAGVVAYLVSWVAGMMGYLIVTLRGLQFYVYMAFAPIPFALLGYEGTRQMGINFIKNFAALCIAGAVMILILILYPYIVSATLSAMSGAEPITDALLFVGVQGALLFALFQSGTWAREVFGG